MAQHSLGGGPKGRNGAIGQESAGDGHILNQLKKIVDMNMDMEVKFQDQTSMMVGFEKAYFVLKKYVNLRTSQEKEAFQTEMWKSADDFEKID